MASSIERPFVAQPAVAAGGKVITSPFQFYSDGTENLRLRIWASLVTNVGLQGRWLRGVGEVHPFRYDFTTVADRLPQEFNLPLDAGYMLNCSLGILGGTVTKIGQVFVQLALVRGRGDAGLEVGTILQGYVATSHWLGFPGSPITHSFEGPGAMRDFQVAAPAVGNAIVQLVPEHARWRLQSIEAGLFTSAVAGNRYVMFNHRSGLLTNKFRYAAANPQAAAQGNGYCIGPSITPQYVAALGFHNIPVHHPHYAEQLDSFQLTVFFMDPGDQFLASEWVVEEWLDTDIYGAPL